MSLEHLRQYLDLPSLCHKPIFVFGAPRSGTHALAFALAAHSQLATHSESEIIAKLFDGDPVLEITSAAEQRVLPTWLRMYNVGKAELYGFLGIGLNALFTSRTPPGKRWIDKTPQYVLIAPILADMFPGAQFLNIIRDGRRVVHSMSRYLERFTNEARAQVLKSCHLDAWATDFRTACRTWRRCIEAGMHFAAAEPGRVFTVRHEELVTGPEKGFDKLFAFLGIPPEPAPLSLFRSCRLNSSFPTRPTDLPAAANLSKPFEQWTLEEGGHFVEPSPYRDTSSGSIWTPERRAIFLEEAGPAMTEYGFADADELERWRAAEPEPPPSEKKAENANLEQALSQELQRIAARILPVRAAVLVAGKDAGDPLTLEGCHTFRYPRVYLPSDSAQAITHLESLRSMGAGYLLFPCTEFWWFEKYPELRTHLEMNYRSLWKDENCVLFELRPA